MVILSFYSYELFFNPLFVALNRLQTTNFSIYNHAQIQRRGAGGPDIPPKNYKNIGFPNSTGPDPMKHHKATKPAASMLDHYRSASETPFEWRFADGKWNLEQLSPIFN